MRRRGVALADGLGLSQADIALDQRRRRDGGKMEVLADEGDREIHQQGREPDRT